MFARSFVLSANIIPREFGKLNSPRKFQMNSTVQTSGVHTISVTDSNQWSSDDKTMRRLSHA